jgi:glucosyl-dolichyl phosphate glucuronosyltransferase
MTHTLSIVIPTYQREVLLARTLEGLVRLAARESEPPEIVVVDNCASGSARDVVGRIQARFPVTYVADPTPGVSHARNRGAASARGDLLWFLDDDVELGERWLSSALAAGDAHPEAGYFCGPVWPDVDLSSLPEWVEPRLGGPESHAGTYLFLDYGGADRRLGPDEPVVSANLGLRRESLRRVGGFRSDLCPIGARHRLGGDTDLHERLVAAGIPGYHVAGAAVRHHTPPARLTIGYALRWSYQHGWSAQYMKAIRTARSAACRDGSRGVEGTKNTLRLGWELGRALALGTFAGTKRRVGCWMRVSYRLGRVAACFAERPDPGLDWPSILFGGESPAMVHGGDGTLPGKLTGA